MCIYNIDDLKRNFVLNEASRTNAYAYKRILNQPSFFNKVYMVEFNAKSHF